MTLPNMKDKTPTAATPNTIVNFDCSSFYLQFVHLLLGEHQIVLKQSLNVLPRSRLHPQ